jgi:hypothetical protein
MRAGLVGGQRILPSLLFCVPRFSSCESRPPSTVQATALLRRPGLETQRLSVFDRRRRHLMLSLTSVSRTPRSAHLGSPLCSLLGPGSLYPGPILFTPELSGSAELISRFQRSEPWLRRSGRRGWLQQSKGVAPPTTECTATWRMRGRGHGEGAHVVGKGHGKLASAVGERHDEVQRWPWGAQARGTRGGACAAARNTGS